MLASASGSSSPTFNPADLTRIPKRSNVGIFVSEPGEGAGSSRGRFSRLARGGGCLVVDGCLRTPTRVVANRPGAWDNAAGERGRAVAVSTREPRMDIRLSDEQRRDFEEKGYIV